MNSFRSNFSGIDKKQKPKNSDSNLHFSHFSIQEDQTEEKQMKTLMLSAFSKSKELYRPESVIGREASEDRPFKIYDTIKPQKDVINGFVETESPFEMNQNKHIGIFKIN